MRIKILVYRQDGTVVARYLLGDGEHTVGRDPGSAIYAESDCVSHNHAKLYLTGEGIFIEDLNSTSGTFLDEVAVRGKLQITPGQRLQIGDLYIEMQTEGAGHLAPGVKLGAGRYVLVKELGRGAMGQVWLGDDTQLEEQVAIKVLSTEVINDAVSLIDLKREVQKSRKLSHDNIIRIHDLMQLPGEPPFITLEFVEGTDLLAIRLHQPDQIFQWSEIKPYVLQLCDALQYAHDHKIVHRDLKPSNMMVSKNGVLKLADFGIAASMVDATGRSSMANIVSGTPQYMSPQQMLGKSPRASDDIYGLGAALYDLLTGYPPFHTGDIAQQVHHITPPTIDQRLAEFGLQNEMPDYVKNVVLSCLAKDAEARPVSAEAIAQWIRTEGKSDSPVKRKKTKTFVGQRAPEERTQSKGESPDSAEPMASNATGRKTPTIAIASGIAALLVGLSVWFFGGEPNKPSPEKQRENNNPATKTSGKTKPIDAGKESQVKGSARPHDFLSQRLVAYYPFNGNANDESGNNNHGKVFEAKLTADRFGTPSKAYGFNGRNALITADIKSLPQGFSPRTLTFWVKANALNTANQHVINWGKMVVGQSFGLIKGFYDSKHDWIFYGHGIGTQDFSAGIQSDTAWHHIVVTYDATHVRVYVDGVFAKSEPRTLNTNGTELVLGAALDKSGYWNGLIDDVGIYDIVLSDREIKTLHIREKP